MDPTERPQDSFRYGPDEVADYADRFTVEPVPPAEIRDRIDDGRTLVTADIPECLDRPIASDVDASIALYRLVQLFGTPNVTVLEAGADQPLREKRTWQYLFRVTHRPEDGDDADEREVLLSVYDYRTNPSVGVSEWRQSEEGARGGVSEPSPDSLPSNAMPGEAFLEVLVKLVLSTVEHAVEATYGDLHV